MMRIPDTGWHATSMSRKTRVSLIPAMLLLVMVPIAGCRSESGAAADPPPGVWTITQLRDDRGHDTIMSTDGDMYHDYFCAVVLEQDDGDSVSLLYMNDLPDSLDLKLGQRFRIDGLDAATWAEHWQGYWLSDVQLIPLGDIGQ